MRDKHWADPKDSCLPHILPDELSSRVNLESLCSLTLPHLWCLDLISQDLCPPQDHLLPPRASISRMWLPPRFLSLPLFLRSHSWGMSPCLFDLNSFSFLHRHLTPGSQLCHCQASVLPHSCVVSGIRLPMASGFEQVINTVGLSY